MTYSLSFQDIYVYFLVFARIAPMMMLLPAFGDLHVPQRIRLMIALAAATIITQLVSSLIPHINPDSPDFFRLLGQEVLIGYFMGICAKIWLYSLQVTANIVSGQSGLSNATLFNPGLSSQDTLIGTALVTFATILIFVTDMHHRFIEVMCESYHLFPPNQSIILADFSKTVTRVVNQSFNLGVKLAFPFLILGLVMQVCLGFLNRLMPQLQVFFVSMPAQTMGGFALLSLTIAFILHVFLNSYDQLLFFQR